jgi:hypothetical protein
VAIGSAVANRGLGGKMLLDAIGDAHDGIPRADDNWLTDVDAFSSPLDDLSSFSNPFTTLLSTPSYS